MDEFLYRGDFIRGYYFVREIEFKNGTNVIKLEIDIKNIKEQNLIFRSSIKSCKTKFYTYTDFVADKQITMTLTIIDVGYYAPDIYIYATMGEYVNV